MFSVQVDVDVVAAARAVTLSHTAKHDLDMLLKTTLTEAFGGAVVRPWLLHRQSGPLAIIVGYSKIPPRRLRHGWLCRYLRAAWQ